jgi:hypothetical protein
VPKPPPGGAILRRLCRSAALGRPALDGDAGKGIPFAQAFAEQMTTPGLRIDDAFRALRDEEEAATDDNQMPEIPQDELKTGAVVPVKSP